MHQDKHYLGLLWLSLPYNSISWLQNIYLQKFPVNFLPSLQRRLIQRLPTCIWPWETPPWHSPVSYQHLRYTDLQYPVIDTHWHIKTYCKPLNNCKRFIFSLLFMNDLKCQFKTSGITKHTNYHWFKISNKGNDYESERFRMAWKNDTSSRYTWQSL